MPTAALDRRGAAQVEHILESYHSTGRTVVFASHDMELVARLASRVAVLEKGQLRYYGNKAEAFQDEKLMDETGLVMPQVPAFMRKLRRKGIPVMAECYTVEQAREAMDALMRKEKRR